MTDGTYEIETNDAAASPNERVVMPAVGEVVAIRYLDNSTGDGDIYNCLAFVAGDGKWVCDESRVELLEYQGDEILEWWPLTPGTGNNAA